MWIKALKTGTFKDLNGVERTFTESDLDTIAGKFDPAARKPPIVKGHPDVDSPAFGWLQGVKREGEFLLVQLGEVVEDFKKQVKDGLYKYVSICLRPDMSIRHLGFLGGHPPAVEGLGEVKFGAEDKGASFQFGDYRMSMLATILQRLRDRFIEKDGVEKTDEYFPQWPIDALREDPDDKRMPYGEGATITKEIPMTPEQQAEMDRLKADNARLTGENTTLTGKVTQAEADKAAAAFASQKAADSTYLESLGSKLFPADRPAALEIMGVLRKHGTDIAFGEPVDGVQPKKPVLDVFKAILETRPEGIAFGEVATAEKAAPANAGAKLNDIALGMIKDNKDLTYGQAFVAAQTANPVLAQAYAAELGR